MMHKPRINEDVKLVSKDFKIIKQVTFKKIVWDRNQYHQKEILNV